MRLTAYILFGLWLSTAVLSFMLRIHHPLSEKFLIEMAEKDSNEKPSDEKEGEKEKDSKEKPEKKSDKETEDKFFEPHNYTKLLAQLYSSRLRDLIHISDEQYICTFSLELDSPPPEFLL